MLCFFFTDAATTEISTLSLHDALPISVGVAIGLLHLVTHFNLIACFITAVRGHQHQQGNEGLDRKSTRLNSSHVRISYAVFCLKKKNTKNIHSRIEPYEHSPHPQRPTT